MSTENAPAARPPRLNPFSFPSDTDFHFVLLIATVVGVSMFYYQLILLRIPFISQRWQATQGACMERVFGQQIEDFRTALDMNLVNHYLDCTRPVQVEKAAWVGGGVLLLLATATIIYWLFPIWKMRHDYLASLSAEDAPEVVTYLAELCQEVALSRPPTFLWNPLSTASSGVAFGRRGRYYVALSGGLISQFYTDRPAFRAMLLHELAHLKNADIDKTYFAVAVWQAFLLVVFLPFVITAVFGDFLRLSFSSIWSVALLAALVYLIRNSVLCVRELYADVRATVWDGANGALGRVLEALPNQHNQRWRSALYVHPSPSERRRTLDTTDSLFRLNFWTAVSTGIAIVIARSGVELWLNLTSQFSLESKSMLSGLIFAPLVVGIVGLGVWRAAFANGMHSKAAIGTGRLAVGVSLGVVIGRLLSQVGVPRADPLGPPLTALSLTYSVTFELLWIGMLVGVLFVLFTWIAAGASIWLEVAAASRSPRLIYVLYLTLASGLFAVAFGWLLAVHDAFELLSTTSAEQMLALTAVQFGFLIISMRHPLALLVFSSLWAAPLAAWFWRQGAVATVTASWAFLDPPSAQLLSRRPASALQPRAAVTMGVAAGLLFCGIVFIIRVLVRLSGLGDAIDILVFAIAQIALAVLMQVGVAVIAAGWVQRSGWVHGLLAAWVGGCAMTIGLLGLNLLFGGTVDRVFAWETFGQVVHWGALLALLPALGVSAIAAWLRRPHDSTTDQYLSVSVGGAPTAA